MSTKKFKILHVENEVNDVIALKLASLDGKLPNYKAGQFLTLVFTFGDRVLRRSYSLYSSPVLDEQLAIAVKLVENGEISRFIHDQVVAGQIIEVIDANGLFVYEPVLEKNRTVFLFAAGVGITPLFSILKTALSAEANSYVVLVYSSRSRNEALFITQLEQWQNRYPDRFVLINLHSSSKNLMMARLNGFLVQDFVNKYMRYDKTDALFYTCGPVDYMDVCRISILGLGFDIAQLKRETFVLPEDEIDEDDATVKVVDKNTYTVTLLINGEEHYLEVPWPKRILDVALAHKLNVPYSCSGGVCSTCAATCIAGGVRMDYNEVLTGEEIAAGRVLICTGHPTENGTIITWR